MFLPRHALTRKDAIFVLVGAAIMHLWSILSPSSSHFVGQSIVIDTQYHNPPAVDPLPPPPAELLPLNVPLSTVTATAAVVITETRTQKDTLIPEPTTESVPKSDQNSDLPPTTVIYHAPGWTLFRNLYMSNGTLYILSSDDPSSFPEIRMITSTGLPADSTPENLAVREPTSANMDFISFEKADQRWGTDGAVSIIEGNTMIFNDPGQFLNHYYHFVAELWFGAWAFWHSAWSKPSTSTPYTLSHPTPPPIHRVIFPHTSANEWRDNPGFNAYFLRAAFPSISLETQQDWEDRIAITTTTHQDRDRVWLLPVALIADRSAAFRGQVCGSRTQRTASEAVEFMRLNHRLMGASVGGWWEPIRAAVWRFAGAEPVGATLDLGQVDDEGEESIEPSMLPMPEKIVITYISRQAVSRRKLLQNDHVALVAALKELVARKGSTWELHVLHAEHMTKDEQIRAAARTTIMLGVHGNGLSHLVFMKPSRASVVIEMFYPGGFAHDYHWTSRALGMDHYAIWNDKYYTYPDEPGVDYPEGFQGNSIPVHGPTVARLIEEHVDRKSKL